VPRPTRHLTQGEYESLRTRFGADDANYNFLNATHPVFGRTHVWDGDYTRQQYLRSVDHLIGVLDGTITKHDVVRSTMVRTPASIRSAILRTARLGAGAYGGRAPAITASHPSAEMRFSNVPVDLGVIHRQLPSEKGCPWPMWFPVRTFRR
jgi:hypothetical protein